MTQVTKYSKVPISDMENTSNGELEHVTLVMKDKETKHKKQKSKSTQCKQFCNKKNLGIAGIAAVLLGIILLILLIVMSLVSSREVHDTLKETIVKAIANQAIENSETRA